MRVGFPRGLFTRSKPRKAGQRVRIEGRSQGRRRRWLRRLGLAAVAGAPFIALAPALPILLLRHVPPPTSAYMLVARHADPATGQPCDGVEYAWVDREAIAPDLRLAVVLAEDQRFLLHHGFDGRSVRRALREREKGRVRGASTISQQVAKNLFLWPEQSFLRKGIEVWLTFWIELLLPKQRILELYLNVAQFGPCVFGAGAASERFFGAAPRPQPGALRQRAASGDPRADDDPPGLPTPPEPLSGSFATGESVEDKEELLVI
jgi:monofunctional biosynthetic peptidoglycan transglycosylase